MRSIASLLAQAVAVAFGVVTVTFLLTHVIPGDPARAVLGPSASPQAVDALRDQLHLNEPLLQQYWHFLGEVAHGSLGSSVGNANQSVTGLIGESLEPTLVLIALTLLISVPAGIVIGLHAGTTRSRLTDLGLRAGTVVGLATPPFFLGSVLLLLLALDLGVAPAGGWATGYPERLRFLWLPALTLSALVTPIFARAVRQRAKVVMRSPYIEAASSRGISRRRIVIRHVLPNSALPAIVLIGINAGFLIAGAVVVETLFGLPGIGSLLLGAVKARNYPVVQGVAIVAGFFVVFCNFAADAVIRAVDPRTRT
ncbi:MAG: ABC transporter permease [Actinobacteria bacterium]|nr:ABC transporter permease [Actinomycetota bacterium]